MVWQVPLDDISARKWEAICSDFIFLWLGISNLPPRAWWAWVLAQVTWAQIICKYEPCQVPRVGQEIWVVLLEIQCSYSVCKISIRWSNDITEFCLLAEIPFGYSAQPSPVAYLSCLFCSWSIFSAFWRQYLADSVPLLTQLVCVHNAKSALHLFTWGSANLDPPHTSPNSLTQWCSLGESKFCFTLCIHYTPEIEELIKSLAAKF